MPDLCPQPVRIRKGKTTSLRSVWLSQSTLCFAIFPILSLLGFTLTLSFFKCPYLCLYHHLHMALYFSLSFSLHLPIPSHVQCVGGRWKIRAHSWETKNFTPTWTWPIPVSQSWNHSNHLGVSQEPTPGSQENRTFCSLWLFSANGPKLKKDVHKKYRKKEGENGKMK